MAEMEELKEQTAQFCWRWRGSNTKQVKKIWEQWPWCWTWLRHPRGSVSRWCGPGRRTSFRYCGCFVGTSSTRGECSSKDAWRSRSGPSRLSCQGQSGVRLASTYCAERQQRYRIDWDATDGRSGGAQRSVWEMLMHMRSSNIAREKKIWDRLPKSSTSSLRP